MKVFKDIVVSAALAALIAPTALAAPPEYSGSNMTSANPDIFNPAFELKDHPVPLAEQPECERNALIARAKWRLNCRWGIRNIFWPSCATRAPDRYRCCNGKSNKSCRQFWPVGDEVNYCQGDIDKTVNHEYMICKCMWRKHCGNW